jgi:hypothetical protein
MIEEFKTTLKNRLDEIEKSNNEIKMEKFGFLKFDNEKNKKLQIGLNEDTRYYKFNYVVETYKDYFDKEGINRTIDIRLFWKQDFGNGVINQVKTLFTVVIDENQDLDVVAILTKCLDTKKLSASGNDDYNFISKIEGVLEAPGDKLNKFYRPYSNIIENTDESMKKYTFYPIMNEKKLTVSVNNKELLSYDFKNTDNLWQKRALEGLLNPELKKGGNHIRRKSRIVRRSRSRKMYRNKRKRTRRSV